jgi:hypothetical protein
MTGRVRRKYTVRQYAPGSIRHLEALRRQVEEAQRPCFSDLDRDVLSGLIRQAILIRMQTAQTGRAAEEVGP